MTKNERAIYVLKRLGELYPVTRPPLAHKDPYTLLIAVILSARCTDERVNQVTPKLFALADNPWDMIKLSFEQVQNIIRPCGLSPMKTNGILGLSEILIKKYEGEVPRSFEQLEALPSVGHKTASVVMVQAFGIPAFPVDTHIHRLAQRWGFSEGRNVKQTEADLKRLFPESTWGPLHLRMIYYGRDACTARGCNGTVCEICKTCFPGRKQPVKLNKQ